MYIHILHFEFSIRGAGLPRYSCSYRRQTSASRAIFFWLRTSTSCCRMRLSASIMLPLPKMSAFTEVERTRYFQECVSVDMAHAFWTYMVMPDICRKTLNWKVKPLYTGLKA